VNSILIGLSNLLDLFALAVLLVGSWIMYKNSPFNKPNDETPKGIWFKRGVLTLSIGFFIALLSRILWFFYPIIPYAN
jgi:hypothetical protein